MQDIIKKDAVYSWGKWENNAFTCVKKAIAKAPTLYNPYFNKYFLLYIFTSDKLLATVLTQKDEMNEKCSISFMSANM